VTRIDFYISQTSRDEDRLRLACKITEKAYKLGNSVYIHTDSTEQAGLIDDLLWTFRDGSFIPHQTDAGNNEKSAPVLIGHNKELQHGADVLINLAHEIPACFSQFERVAEIVNDTPDSTAHARERYKFYRDRGYELQTHKL
jgi:DNA polymerase-3 subunit chi